MKTYDVKIVRFGIGKMKTESGVIMEEINGYSHQGYRIVSTITHHLDDKNDLHQPVLVIMEKEIDAEC
jgi:hypothetical protein